MNLEQEELLKSAKYNTKKRIIELIQLYCEGSQTIFAEKTGITRAAVSQYVNGKRQPNNLVAEKIGKAFNVSPAWVMGFNATKDREQGYEEASRQLEAGIKSLENALNKYRRLSPKVEELNSYLLDCTDDQLDLLIEVAKNFHKKGD